MPFLPVAVLGVLLVVSLFVNSFLLWLSSKICGVRREAADPTGAAVPSRAGISFKRALGVVLTFSICANLLTVALWFVMSLQSETALSFDITALVVYQCLLFAFMRILVSPTPGRAILVGLLWQIFSTVYVAICVFLVGSYLVHADIISAGSMAETVRGYHKDVHCPACGYEFAANCSAEADPADMARASKTFACICPNCRQRIHFPGAPASYHRDYPDSVETADPGVSGGDRIMVGQGLLGASMIAPRRFDLVVHRYPPKPSLTYLKRLVCLPRETLAIRGGDLYVLGPGKGPKYDDPGVERESESEYERKALLHANDPKAVRLFRAGQFEILHKSPEHILAMRHIVFDNDHRAPNQPPRWQGEAGWKEGDNHTFAVTGETADQTAWLRYRHLLPENDGKPALITDFIAYNAYSNGLHPPLVGQNWVGDLILECVAAVEIPQGELTLELSRGVDRFRARWDLANGACTLSRVNKDGEQKLDSKPTVLNTKGTFHLRFAHVDRRLIVWVNDHLPFADGVSYPPPDDIGPHADNDLQPVGIGVRGGSVAVRALKLFRDTYYTVGGIENDRPNEPDVPGVDPTDSTSWKPLHDPPLLTLYVQPGQYFVLGDNSSESSDSRMWGCVPDRLLLGRAFFVYYPLQRVGPLR